MRKFNAVLTLLILVLFLMHGVLGSFQIIGIGNTALKIASWIGVGLIVIHTVIGIKLTADTLIAQKKSGAHYFKENKLFWIRRISGFAVMVLMFFHLTAFGYTDEGVYRLHPFTMGKLAAQILLLMALTVHVISNIKPLMIALGVKSMKRWIVDILFVLSILILFMAVAFVIYYLRWNEV